MKFAAALLVRPLTLVRPLRWLGTAELQYNKKQSNFFKRKMLDQATHSDSDFIGQKAPHEFAKQTTSLSVAAYLNSDRDLTFVNHSIMTFFPSAAAPHQRLSREPHQSEQSE